MCDASKNILVICGPTASGKTKLAVNIAKRMNAEILSGDSRQIYKGMDIGTGKDKYEYENVTYHLIDIVEPEKIFSLYDFQREAYTAISDILGRNLLPIFAGGSGLYIESVLKNYQIPNVPEDVKFRAEKNKVSITELKEELFSIDQELYKKTDLSSKKRIIRAIEIAKYAKNHIIEWGYPNPPKLNPCILGIRFERKILHDRIDMRLQQRFDMGMVEEVERLKNSGVSRERFSLLGLEYNNIASYLYGEIDYESMVEKLRMEIYRFAKRQDTWFRGMERRGLKINWIDNCYFEQAWSVVCENFKI